MPIYVDDIPLNVDDAQTLHDAIVAAKERLGAAGRIIVEISIAGEALVGEQIEQHLSDDIGDTEVRLVSTDPKAEAVSTLEQIREHLDEASRVQAKVADLLQRDQGAEAMLTIGDALTVWQQMTQGIAQCAAMTKVSLDDLSVEGQTVGELITQLKMRINELYEYLTNRDTVALADALAYEWPDVTKRWQCVVDELIQAIDKT